MEPNGVRILLVDDQIHFRAAARELLEARGHTVVESASRGDALAAAASFAPDAALIDVRLGDDTGADVTRALLERMPGLVVVLMSADAVDPPAGGTGECGARAFIPKRRLVAADLSRLFAAE
jgi:DNA-binding NarL/FixJ family response regulator